MFIIKHVIKKIQQLQLFMQIQNLQQIIHQLLILYYVFNLKVQIKLNHIILHLLIHFLINLLIKQHY